MPELSDAGADESFLADRLERVALVARISAAIYGLIVSGAVMAAAGEHGSARDVVVTVFITVLVYWAAESYADVLGEQVADRRRSSWHRTFEIFGQGWPLVEASFVPLAVLVIVWAVGASSTAAITAGLVTNALLLVALGWIAATKAERSLPGRIFAAAVAGTFGVIMIAIKTLLH